MKLCHLILQALLNGLMDQRNGLWMVNTIVKMDPQEFGLMAQRNGG